jgi:3-oxoacyl-[acyl-carrier-protein] synthase II
MSTFPRRVVVTGMGTISGLGETPADLWDAVSKGRSCIGPITLIPAQERTVDFAGEHTAFDPTRYIHVKQARRMDRFAQLGLSAARLAWADAAVPEGVYPSDRFSVVVGSGAGGLSTIYTQLVQCQEKGFAKCSPFLVPMMIPDSTPGLISIDFKAHGPNFCVSTACATGNDSIGNAYRLIQNDEADVVIAGSSEAAITSVAMAGFAAARALSTRSEDPTKACRPFDRGRDGFVMSEGAGILVLEEYEQAKQRGARIYAEIVGYGRSSDANDMVQPCSNGTGAKLAMRAALRQAKLDPEAIAYINAHATSTPLGDIAESKAIKEVFGPYAKQGLLVSATKSMHGHALGGAGGLEAVITIQSLLHQVAPPTINLEDPDPECDLDYVPNRARSMKNAGYAMSNAFGFFGHNASLIFKRV